MLVHLNGCRRCRRSGSCRPDRSRRRLTSALLGPYQSLGMLAAFAHHHAPSSLGSLDLARSVNTANQGRVARSGAFAGTADGIAHLQRLFDLGVAGGAASEAMERDGRGEGQEVEDELREQHRSDLSTDVKPGVGASAVDV